MAFRMPPAAAVVRLQCPAAPGFYAGMDAPTAMCSNCFKKRREHMVPPEIAIEADKAASQAAHAQAASAAAAAIKTEQLRAAAAEIEGKMLAEKISANCASAEAVAAAAAASKLQAAAAAEHLAIAAACTQVRRDSEVQALNEKQLEELAAKKIAEERQKTNAAELAAAAVAKSNIEAAAAEATAVAAAAAKFSDDVHQLNSLLSHAVALASDLRWHPAGNRQAIVEAAVSSIKQVCNDLVHLNTVNSHSLAPHSAQANAAPLQQPNPLPTLPATSSITVQPVCTVPLPASVLPNVDPRPSPPPCSQAPAPSPASSAPIAINTNHNSHAPSPMPPIRTEKSKSESHVSVVPLSPPPAAPLSSIDERPVSFSMKPRRPGAPPSRPAPKPPVKAASLSGAQPPTSNQHSESTEKIGAEDRTAPGSESPLAQSAHPSPAPATKFALPGMALPAMAKSPAAPETSLLNTASSHSVVSGDDSSYASHLSKLPDVVPDANAAPPHPSPPRPAASTSPAPAEPMNLAAAAASRRGLLRTLSQGDAPQFKPPSSPAAAAGLKCPEGEGGQEAQQPPKTDEIDADVAERVLSPKGG